MGVLHKKLEKELKKYLGVDGISLMINGHMSLELAIAAMRFPKGSEVITTKDFADCLEIFIPVDRYIRGYL